ncbi:hypothetical protein GCM10010965_04770 [Caldalkalibacillus thermarum]|uniref:hypothetical protein n=1 Tax=Caldalkalibacillus thermarum TaxID=296745 RepID=UPI00166524EC|nr:hypothetical protein [Caldalkalibacillus thermarum]GGK14790.1 hypothetical protein GCM10010965_04770 [Caldalkalibacillus thermarum]
MEYLLFEGTPDRKDVLDGILELHDLIFNTELPLDELKQKKGVLVLAAMEHHAVVGYKIGYERKPKHYYSWLGGVDPLGEKTGPAVAKTWSLPPCFSFGLKRRFQQKAKHIFQNSNVPKEHRKTLLCPVSDGNRR